MTSTANLVSGLVWNLTQEPQTAQCRDGNLFWKKVIISSQDFIIAYPVYFPRGEMTRLEMVLITYHTHGQAITLEDLLLTIRAFYQLKVSAIDKSSPMDDITIGETLLTTNYIHSLKQFNSHCYVLITKNRED